MARLILHALMLLAFVSCDRKAETGYDLLQKDDIWTLAFGDAHGGTQSIGFINSNGQIIHVIAHFSTAATSARGFSLVRCYDDPLDIELLPHSDVEKAVLKLLDKHERRPQIQIPEAYARRFAALIRNRSLPYPHVDDWYRPS